MPARVLPPTAVVGITDREWFESLRRLPAVDEVNFWQPSPGVGRLPHSTREPFLFKLHSPVDTVGVGFYARWGANANQRCLGCVRL